MPELPDLTVYSENLTKRLKNKKVKSVEYYGANRLNVAPEELKQLLCESNVLEINRLGKEIEFVFSNGTRLLIHLMLTGEFVITKSIQNIQNKIFSLTFDDGDILVIKDPKGIAKINFNPVPINVPDALDVTSDYLKRMIREKPRMNIKVFLIDPKIVRGIGNAYADEILWRAKISPRSVVGKIPENVINDLLAATKTVLLEAIEQIKKINPQIISGEVRDFLAVHNSKRKVSPTGHPIIREEIASKPTYYTDEQILYS